MMTDIFRIGLNPEEKRLLIFLFIASLVSAVYQAAVILQFAVAVFTVQTGAYLFFAFLHIFFGVGAFYANKYHAGLVQEKSLRRLFLILGICIILSFFFSLRITVSAPAIIAAILFACFCFFLFGVIFSLNIVYFNGRRPGLIGLVIVCGNIGLILGFLLQPYLMLLMGLNAVCFALGIFCLLLSGRSMKLFCAAVLLIIAVSVHFPVDQALEEFRAKRTGTLKQVAGYFGGREDYAELFNGWSQDLKLNIFRETESGEIVGAYNYRLAWRVNRAVDPGDRQLLDFIDDGDKILIIGSAAGQTGFFLPLSRELTKQNTTMVEQNRRVVEYFRDRHPDYNDRMYRRVTAIAADGRTVLDETKEKWDCIIIESMKLPVMNVWMLDRSQTTMLTTECFQRCFHALEEDGVLFGVLPNSVFVNIVCSSLDKLGVCFDVYECPKRLQDVFLARFVVYASRSGAPLERIRARMSPRGMFPARVAIDKTMILTDDRPFFSFVIPQKNTILRVLFGSAAVLLALAAGILFCMPRERRGKLLFFFLIGIGFFLTQMVILGRFRSFFSGPLATIMAVSPIFLASVSLGNFFSKWLAVERLKREKHRNLFITAAVTALFFAAISHVPASISNHFLKVAVAALIIMPMGMLCGFFYPVGLRVNENRNLGAALLLDGIGTCTAVVLFYAAGGIWGISVNYVFVFLAYCAAAVLIAS